MTKYKIGETITLPQEYYDMVAALPPNGLVVLGSNTCEPGVYAFIKNGVLIKIIHKEFLETDHPAAGVADAILANVQDIDGTLKEWMEAADKLKQ